MVGRAAQPTTLREKRSRTTARYSHPLPRPHVRDVCDPGPIRSAHRESALQHVGDRGGWLADRPAPRAIAVQRSQPMLAHQPRNAMLAAGLAGLAQIEEHTRRPVDALAGDERRANQAQQAGVLLGAVRQRLLPPGVVATGRDLEHAAQHLNRECRALRLDEFIRGAYATGGSGLGHRRRPSRGLNCLLSTKCWELQQSPQAARGPQLSASHHPTAERRVVNNVFRPNTYQRPTWYIDPRRESGTSGSSGVTRMYSGG